MTDQPDVDTIVTMQARLEGCGTLPSPPGIAEKILTLAEDTGASTKDFAEVVRVDVALTSRLLQLANSPVYGLSRTVYDVRHAITVLGLEATLTNALSIALVSSIKQQESPGIDYQQFWRRSLATASANRLLARHTQVRQTEQYFMAGLLQDIGMVALASVEPSVYQQLGRKQQDHSAIISAEQATFGTDHTEAGGWLIENWKLPTLYAQAARGSHIPASVECEPDETPVIFCTATAATIADVLYGTERLQAVRRALALRPDITRLEPAALINLLPRLVEELSTLGELFDLDLGSADLLEQRAAEATAQLETLAKKPTPRSS